MLKSIVIKNFQSHKKTIIKLVKGVNVIIGKSQAGKTAILRALNIVRTNRPSGSRFVRHGENEVLTTIRTMEGDKVSLKKTPTERIYIVNDSKFRKFGTAVPEEVSEVLRMSDVNIQSQLDSPFLVTSTGGEVTKTINRITKAEKVDKWVKIANKNVNDLTREKTTTFEDIKKARRELKVLKDLPDIASEVGKVELKLSEERRATNKWNDLDNNIPKLERREKELQQIESICNLRLTFERVFDCIHEKDETKTDVLMANSFIYQNSRMKKIGITISRLQKEMGIYTHIDQRIVGINETIEHIESFMEEMSKLRVVNKKVGILRQSYLDKMKEEKVCPTCFGEVNTKVLERIKSEI